jgi:hypothetical protein
MNEIIATQNPLDLAGTFPLPSAQLDRFLFKVKMKHIHREAELEILASYKARRDGAGADWRDFVRRCAAADSPLLILVPWPPRYWPADLGLFPQLVHWHPATTATMLRRQRGLAHRVAR